MNQETDENSPSQEHSQTWQEEIDKSLQDAENITQRLTTEL